MFRNFVIFVRKEMNEGREQKKFFFLAFEEIRALKIS